ncbi:MAG: glycosyltransferase family 4 protein [Anaerolineae bacterium]|nr:glycosyltransferase family 4 protein [Anaerolineae bacterium]
MRILMLAPTMFFADYGCHVRILEEANILQQMGHQVTILAYPNGRDIAGLRIERCWGVPFNYRVIVGSSRHKIYLDVMLGLKALRYVLRNRPDIIHAHLHEGALLGWFLSRLTGAPLVFDFQGSMTAEMIDHHFLSGPDSRWYRPLRWLERRIDRAAPIVLTSSLHASQLLHKEFGVPSERVVPLPDCVNSEIFSPQTISSEERMRLKRALGIPPDRQVIVYLGLLTEYQGIGLLLEAVRALASHRADFHVLLMGFPHAVYQVRAIEMGLAERFTFTGKLAYEDAPRFLALGDIAVAPKLSATEGSGKILNYMSMALPTVAFPVPVSREYLGDLGIYAAECSASALATALEEALNMNPTARTRLGARLRERACSAYSWHRAGEQLVAVYRRLLDERPHSAYRRVPLSRFRL